MVAHFSDLEAERLDRQRTGGDGNLDGAMFEEVVSLVWLVELAEEWVRDGRGEFGGKIARQIWGPVDDIACLYPSGTAVYIQARSGEKVLWDSAKGSLKAAYELFLKLPADEETFNVFEVAHSQKCLTLNELRNGMPESLNVRQTRYQAVNLPIQFRKNARLLRGLDLMVASGEPGALLQACVALRTALQNLLWQPGRRAASVVNLLAESACLAPGTLASVRVDASDYQGRLDEFRDILPLKFLASGCSIRIDDPGGDRIVIDFARPLFVEDFIEWLSDARPQTVMGLTSEWGAFNG